MASDERDVLGLGEHVLDIVRAEGDAITLIIRDQLCGVRNGGRGLLGDLEGGGGEDLIEAEGIGDNTGDFVKLSAELGVLGVLGAIKGRTDLDGLGVGVCSLSVGLC